MLEIDELNELIEDIFINLTDLGFTIEVGPQNGNTTYQIYNSDIHLYGSSSDLLSGKYVDLKYRYLDIDIFTKELDTYLKSMDKVNKELTYIKQKIESISGLKKFNFIPPCRLEISFNHKPQGFGNLRSYVLVGSDKNKVYGV